MRFDMPAALNFGINTANDSTVKWWLGLNALRRLGVLGVSAVKLFSR